MRIIKQANDYFRGGDIALAYSYYKMAEKKYGEVVVRYNLSLCEKKLKDLYHENNKSSILNEIFDHIYVVNLEKQIKNKFKIVHHLANHGVKFDIFKASNGYEGELFTKYQEYAQKNIGELVRFESFNSREIKRGSLFIESAGAMGYIHTYINILQDAKNNKYSRILILEDDVILDNCFENKLSSFKDVIGDDWKIIQLGASQYGWDSVDVQKAKKNGYYHPRVLDTCGSFALGIDASIIDQLIEVESYYEAPFDHVPLGEIYEKHIGKCFVAFPNIVIPDVSSSTIRGGRNQLSHAIKMKWDMDSFDYPVTKPSISIIIKSHDNLKYYKSFSDDLPYYLRLYYLTTDGMRPLHTEEILRTRFNKILSEPEYPILPQSNFVATIDANEILTEESIECFIMNKLKMESTKKSNLTEINCLSLDVVNGRVSVIIPTYNRPKNLANALLSVVNQDYDNIEIIVVNDNGKDSIYNEQTRQIVMSYLDVNENCVIKYIEHESNRNGAAARNTGILNSTGEFICFLDDDDIYLDGRLSSSILELSKHPKSIGGIYCGFLGWNSPSNDIGRYKAGDLTLELLLLDYKKHYLHTNTVTYRREAVMTLNGFDESFVRHQDVEFNLRFFNEYRIGCIEKALVRLNPEVSEISNKMYNKDMIELKTKFLDRFRGMINKFDVDIQRKIYEAHLNEILRYVNDKQQLIEWYEEKISDYSAQIVKNLYSNELVR